MRRFRPLCVNLFQPPQKQRFWVFGWCEAEPIRSSGEADLQSKAALPRGLKRHIRSTQGTDDLRYRHFLLMCLSWLTEDSLEIRNPNSSRRVMMRANAILRAMVLLSAALCFSLATSAVLFAQDVGADVGVGAGIFRAKNPETKKKTTGTKPANRSTGPARTRAANTERIEDLLEKG